MAYPKTLELRPASAPPAPPAPQRAALGAPTGSPRLTLDGIEVAYADVGAGPAVVCLHAIGHGAGDFARLRDRLSDRYRVVTPDWPAQGRSGDDREPPTAARYADLLGRLLDALELERVVLVGNSIGGAAALRYAATHLGRVRGLVLENPGGLDPADRLAHLAIGSMARFFTAGVRGAWWFPRAFAAYYRLVLPRRAAAWQRAHVVAAAAELAPLLAAAWRGFGQPAADLRALAPRVTCPVLFAWATRDRFVQLRRCRPAIARFSRAELVTFPAGHAAHLETPEAFEVAVERFLARL